MSIRLKLFAILLLTTLTLVGGMYGFMRWSLADGFSQFMDKRHQERVDNVLDALTDYYASQGSWQALIADRRQWLDVLWRANRHHRPPPEFRHFSRRPPPPPDSDEQGDGFVPFEHRVLLLDAQQNPLIGRTDLLKDAELRPVEYQQQVVGYLAVMPGKPVMLPLERQFFNQQNRAFIVIALVMLLLSALLAVILAYILGKPLKRIAAVVQQLATGDYQPRLQLPARDELGRLAADINHLAQTLAHTEASRRQWVADISHELRTPLAVLRAQLEALQDGIRPLQPQAIDLLMADVLRLNRLTDDLYQLALSDQNALSYHKIAVQPLKLLDSVVNGMLDEFSQKSLTVHWQQPLPEACWVVADPDRLAQVFRNILTNSGNYTDAGGQLQLSAYRADNCLWLDFADSAPGVELEDLSQLFERFYRVESSRSRHYGGAGLGLALCQSIIQAHDGQIRAEHSTLGGLSISICLPLISAPSN